VPESIDGSLHARWLSGEQMHTPDDRVKWPSTGNTADVCQGVNHTGMSASKNHHQPTLPVEIKRLVIQQRIRAGTASIPKEAPPRVFKVIYPGDFAGDENPRQDFR